MRCPKCDLAQPDGSVECPRCGVIFAKLGGDPKTAPDAVANRDPYGDAAVAPPEPRSDRSAEGHPPRAAQHSRSAAPGVQPTPIPAPAAETVPPDPVGRDIELVDEEPYEEYDEFDVFDDESPPEPRRLDRTDLLPAAAGLAIAVFAFGFWFLRQTFQTLLILVHEMGHFLFGWAFGYPSFPAFDLMYGGGVTIHGSQSPLLLLLIYALMGALIYTYRRNVATVIFLSSVTALHMLFAFTSLHSIVILFMGHGTELVIASIFLFRALSGSKIVHAIERPLYAAVGFFIVFHDLAFAYRLVTSAGARAEYEDAKGGGHWMDFSRIAEDHLQTDLTTVAGFFLILCVLPPILAYLTFRYQEHIAAGVRRLAMRHAE